MRRNNGMNTFLSNLKKVCGVAVMAAAFMAGASFIAACASPAGDDGKDLLSKTNFVPVTGITISGVSEEGEVQPDTVIAAQVEPSTATVKTIVWSVAEGSEVSAADVEVGENGATFTPKSEGLLKLTATIEAGGAGAKDFTKDFEITVSADAEAVFVPVTGITISGVSEEGEVQPDTVIAAQVEPSTATVKTIVWSVADDSEVPAADVEVGENGATFTPKSEGLLKLTATIAGGVAEGEDFTKDFTITVSADAPEGSGNPVGSGEPTELTGDVYFGNVFEDSDTTFTLNVDDEDAEREVGITIGKSDIREGKKAHFTVTKTAAQTVSLASGGDAGIVTLTTSGSMANTAANNTTTIVSVDLDDFDAQFEGKDFTFTLTVQEDGTLPLTYTINLTATPHFTGSAIFVVDRSGTWVDCGECGDSKAREITFPGETEPASDGRACVKGGTITRITDTNKLTYAYGGGGEENESTYGVSLDDVTNLTNALVWVNHNAATQTEYLIRVEDDERLVRHSLSVNVMSSTVGVATENVIVRLRGIDVTIDNNNVNLVTFEGGVDGADCVLQYDHTLGSTPNVAAAWKKDNGRLKSPTAGNGWFNIGGNADKKITLQIENNITLDCESIVTPNNNFLRNVIHIQRPFCVFIMEEGSKITRFVTGNSTSNMYAVINAGTQKTHIWIKGGTLTNNNVSPKTFIYSGITIVTPNSFKNTGGTFSGNTSTYLNGINIGGTSNYFNLEGNPVCHIHFGSLVTSPQYQTVVNP